jgi:antirestriction protein ArdC
MPVLASLPTYFNFQPRHTLHLGFTGFFHKPISKENMKNQTYDRITDRITALLEQGTVPWHKPWTARTGLPRNAVSKKPYRGINVFLLIAMMYESPLWLTFRQVSQLGGSVRKGEKACPVVFWKQTTVEDKESGEQKKKYLLRFYHVFNVSQCDGLKIGTEPVQAVENGIVKPEEIVAGMPQPPVLKHGMTHSYYSPRKDCVCLPVRERFDRSEDYYSTVFHELVHSTGHEKRLKRFTESAEFGSNPYCKEELIAEMGAAFLCGQAEIAERTIDNSAAYLKGWLEQLRNDKTLIVQAAAQAQKAADFILGNDSDETAANITEKITPPPQLAEACA